MKVGDNVIYEGREYKVLGFAASEDSQGQKLVEIAWDDYQVSPTSGYLAVPRANLYELESTEFVLRNKDTAESVTIKLRNNETQVYAVSPEGSDRLCISKDGKVDYEPMPSNRTDEFLENHRFSKHVAILVGEKYLNRRAKDVWNKS